ncbi:MAG: FMN-binding protein [Erysipelotrichaceae bacterium]
MKKILHLTIFLALISAIAGGALAYANELTLPIINKNAMIAEKANLEKMFPDVNDFTPVEVKKSKTIEKIFKTGDLYIFKMRVTGYKDGTVFLVALDSDKKIVNFVVESNGDTSGIGSKVGDSEFKDTLLDKKAEDKLDVISGATISSKPIVDGIHEAATYYSQNLK